MKSHEWVVANRTVLLLEPAHHHGPTETDPDLLEGTEQERHRALILGILAPEIVQDNILDLQTEENDHRLLTVTIRLQERDLHVQEVQDDIPLEEMMIEGPGRRTEMIGSFHFEFFIIDFKLIYYFRRRSRSPPYGRDRAPRARSPIARRSPPVASRGTHRPRSRSPDRRDDRASTGPNPSNYRRRSPSPAVRESDRSSGRTSGNTSRRSSPAVES